MSTLAIPDPRTTPIPFGWAEATFLPWAENAEWDELDSYDAGLAAIVSWLEEHGREAVEPEKARRIVEHRRAGLLGPKYTRKADMHVSIEASEKTISRWRQIGDAWEWLWPEHIAPATEHRDVTQAHCLRLVSQRSRPEAGPLLDGTYRTIVADPPWRYDNRGTRGAAEDHYGTMSIEDICELAEKIPAADDSHLYLWATNAFLRPAFDVVEAWGFNYKTCLTWVKPQIGLGNYFRNATEHVLFAVRGILPTQVKDVPTYFEARRGKHSAKPDSFLDIVETASPGPYLEMFARRRRMGWDGWGNEA